MNLKLQIGSVAVIAAAMLATTTTAGAFDRGGGYRDGRLLGTSGDDAVAYFRANELSTLVQSVSPAGLGLSYVDGGQRPGAVGNSPAMYDRLPVTTGFDWGDAAVGASSALVLVLLVGGGLVVTRHSRGSELAR